MKKTIILFAFLATGMIAANAQTKIKDGTVSGSSSLPNSAAVLELESANKGFLPPQVALTDAATWTLTGSPTSGMVVYNTATITGTNALAPGLVVWINNKWQPTSQVMWPYRSNDSLWGTYNNGQGIVSASGAGLVASGQYSHAEGYNDTASGSNSVVFGRKNASLGNFNILSGDSNRVYPGSGSGFSATAAGSFDIVSGLTNNVLGGLNIVSGQNQWVEHKLSLVVGGSDTLLGGNGGWNIVGGSHNTITSTAAGRGTSSIVGGYTNSLTDVVNSIVVGTGDTLTGTGTGAASVFGYYNKVSADAMPYSTTVGKFNANYTGALFSVGVGTNTTSRANGFVVTNTKTTGATANGLIVLIPSLPTYADDSAAASDSSLPSGGLYKIGTTVHIKP